jgi:hypothetical protein
VSGWAACLYVRMIGCLYACICSVLINVNLSLRPRAPPSELELNDVNPRKTPAYIRAQFDIYDGDKDGFITARELADLCKSLGNPLDKDELAVALQMLDNDRCGFTQSVCVNVSYSFIATVHVITHTHTHTQIGAYRVR